jgi:hypothetical protein
LDDESKKSHNIASRVLKVSSSKGLLGERSSRVTFKACLEKGERKKGGIFKGMFREGRKE